MRNMTIDAMASASRSNCAVKLAGILAFVIGAMLICLMTSVPLAHADTITTLDELDGHPVGVVSGSLADVTSLDALPNIDRQEYTTSADAVTALLEGKVDGVIVDSFAAEDILRLQPDLALLEEPVTTGDCGYIFAKDNAEATDLRLQVNDFIAKSKADGTLKDIIDRWEGEDESKKPTPDYESLPATNGTIVVATESETQPCEYIRDGELVGLDIEFLTAFAKAYGYGLEFMDMNFGAIIPAVQSGKVDMGACSIAITAERQEVVDFSDPYCGYAADMLVRAKQGANMFGMDFFSMMATSFTRTFINEGRWQLILSGLGITLLISLLSVFFGTLIGFGLCMQRRMKNKVASGAAAAFIRIVQGIPVLVMLMVLFYIVFASGGVSGIVVAVIGFSFDFGVYVAEELRAGIGAVGTGQWEAASALGFTRAQTFFKIVLPQAARTIMPLYKGQVISLVKMTSVVGYIAIRDLTKVSDIIRARTYEAFFPLISTAIIYFLLAWCLTLILGIIERRMDPKHRKNPFSGMTETEKGTGRKTGFGAAVSDLGSMRAVSGGDKPEGADAPIIRVEHLRKDFATASPLVDVTFSVKRGEVVSVIGPSGVGKSTLLRCLNRLDIPTGGTVAVFGQDMGARGIDANAIRRRMGMVFQTFNLFPQMTVMENICFAPMKLNGLSAQEAFDKGMALLRTVGLAQKWQSYPDELSGGQRQRVAIARTLAMDPDIVLFDEPTSALDPTMVIEVLCVIRNLAEAGLTMMIVTHEMRFARDVSTRVMYLDEGIIYEDGTSKQVFEEPRRPHTRAFIQRIRSFSHTITSADYDFVEFVALLVEFGHREFVSEKRVLALERLFEELCAVNIIPAISADETRDFKLDVLVEFSRTDAQLVMRLTYDGEKYDPFEHGDEISLAIVDGVSSKRSYSYEPGGENGGYNVVEIVL